MAKRFLSLFVLAAVTTPVTAQDVYYGDQFAGGAAAYSGAGSFGSGEPLYSYDDQERWKHGYLQIMPYYGGFHSFRPYNYHHVFGQSQTAIGWGMPGTMPYSQQFWHRYERQADLARPRQDGTTVEPSYQPAPNYISPQHVPSAPTPAYPSTTYSGPSQTGYPQFGQAVQPTAYQPQTVAAPAYASGNGHPVHQTGAPAYAVPTGSWQAAPATGAKPGYPSWPQPGTAEWQAQQMRQYMAQPQSGPALR